MRAVTVCVNTVQYTVFYLSCKECLSLNMYPTCVTFLAVYSVHLFVNTSLRGRF